MPAGHETALLIIWGREDRMTPVSHADGAEIHLTDAESHVIPRCGQRPQLERSEEFNRPVLSFLGWVHESKEAL